MHVSDEALSDFYQSLDKDFDLRLRSDHVAFEKIKEDKNYEGIRADVLEALGVDVTTKNKG